MRVGEAALREVAAYLLDHAHFARVPHTTLVRASHPVFTYAALGHLLEGGGGGGEEPGADGAPPLGLPPKLGSLQEFVSHLSDTSELGAARLSKRDVHRIGILDVSPACRAAAAVASRCAAATLAPCSLLGCEAASSFVCLFPRKLACWFAELVQPAELMR